MPDPSSSNADGLKLQLLTARKKELPQAVTCQTVIHTFRLLVRRATSSDTETTKKRVGIRTVNQSKQISIVSYVAANQRRVVMETRLSVFAVAVEQQCQRS